jgi:hypothetical protein
MDEPGLSRSSFSQKSSSMARNSKRSTAIGYDRLLTACLLIMHMYSPIKSRTNNSTSCSTITTASLYSFHTTKISIICCNIILINNHKNIPCIATPGEIEAAECHFLQEKINRYRSFVKRKGVDTSKVSSKPTVQVLNAFGVDVTPRSLIDRYMHCSDLIVFD